MEKILFGKPVAQSIIENISTQLSTVDLIPNMVIVKIGDDPASEYYFHNIIKQGTKLGMNIKLDEYPQTITTQNLKDNITKYNSNPKIHGILIQKPLPNHISADQIDNCIVPEKDIDGIHPINLGKLFLSQDCFVPCTAAAVIEIIKYYQISTVGKHVVILGRSSVVAKPLVGLLLKKSDYGNATITVCHSYTPDISLITKNADILITAIGKPNFVTSDMINENTICLDVGINLVHDDVKGEIYVGDIDYQSCFDKSQAISPVPGGIGTITTSMLLLNLLKATIYQNT